MSLPRTSMLAIALLLGGLATPAQTRAQIFTDVTEEWGVSFRHRHFGTGEKFMPENMGAGVALADFDGDGRLDLYFVQGAPLPRRDDPPMESRNQLFLQKEPGRFADATERSGAGDRGVGMGVAWADLERDGDLDLFVTNFGENVLLRNLGEGRFEAVAEAGVENAEWGAGAGFFDADNDGDLDLFVTNYLTVDLEEDVWCGNAQSKTRAYCHPDIYPGAADRLFLNRAESANGLNFVDVSDSAGLAESKDAKGLGVGLLDLDEDGLADIVVANDSTPNHVYLSTVQGGGRKDAPTYRESALELGLALSGDGAPEAGMGLVQEDFDGDGRPELFFTHLDQETNTLYREIAPQLWQDVSERAGLGAPSLTWVGFGVEAIDFDNDGDLDLFVTNGHIIDNIAEFSSERAHAQPLLLFQNDGTGRFRDVSESLAPLGRFVGRGTAQGDLDGDGDLDLVVTQNDGPARILRNDGPAGNSCQVRLSGSRSNVHGWGAKLTATVGARTLVRWARGSSGYLSQGSPTVWFGLAAASRIDRVRVDWPSGLSETFAGLVAGTAHHLVEGSGTLVDAAQN
ncbi:MAG: CRTAC1 family protein [Acidobacteriota bacterium]